MLLVTRRSFLHPVLLCAALMAGACGTPDQIPADGPPPDVIRVMTFNLWHGGEAGKQPLEQSAQAIRAARADIVGLQETHGLERNGMREDNGRRLAELLGWHYIDQGSRTGILSRWPIIEDTASPATGVVINLPSGRQVRAFNVHLAHAPYQPYQLLRIPYENAPFLTSARDAADAARAARGLQVGATVANVRDALLRDEFVVLTGDFNEPSHLDWTARAAEAGIVPLAVPYPTTLAVEAAGLRDAFRSVNPDEVSRPGWTWTPITRPDDPKDRHDRIDLVFVGGAGVNVTACEIVGEHADTADIVVQPWPSDHRAVVAEVIVSHR